MSKENLNYYELLRSVPDEAKKTILGGRLKGFTDINPMWRIKKLTEVFGMCGVGWYFEVTKEKEYRSESTNEVAKEVEINLYVKVNGEWSKPIVGRGGSMIISKEKGGLYLSDEHSKMAITDAIGSAAKLLGLAADVYFEKDRTKYDVQSDGDAVNKSFTDEDLNNGVAEMLACKSYEDVTLCWGKWISLQKETRFINACKKVQVDIKAKNANK
jgi:hypothetical protein